MRKSPLKRGKQKLRKYGKSTIAKLKKELDKLWSLFIRKRDKFTCQRCGSLNKWNQAAHIFSRNNLSVRYAPENGICLCYGCHIIFAHRNPIEFTEWIREKLGEEKYQALKAKANKIYQAIDLPKDAEKIKKELTQ